MKESLAEEEEERREAVERDQLIRQCARLKKAYAEWLVARKRGDNSPPGYRFLARKHHVYPVRLHRVIEGQSPEEVVGLPCDASDDSDSDESDS